MTGYKSKKKAAQDKLAQQEPVAWMYDWLCDGKLITGWVAHSESEIPKTIASNILPLYTTPPLAGREWNFCERCGKRTADLTVIHTCTPPQENT